jgi:GDPmannose 4,6-dehydratase
MKKALICGISGQDGAYLAQLLLEKGYKVYGTSRDAQISSFSNLEKLGLLDDITLESMAPTDFRSVIRTLKNFEPDEVYNLAGQSSVGLSFQKPVETFESIVLGCMNILEGIRFIDLPVRFYNACSGECFGDTGEQFANENTPFRPRSPYAVAKAAAFWKVSIYREAYNMYACSGILFNHESPLRPKRFVTGKIVAAACRIAAGSKEKLSLGNLAIRRDWGWAPEYVEAMWMMMQKDEPEDLVVATGQTHSLEEFVSAAFQDVGLQWKDHVETDENLFRPLDIMDIQADPSKALKSLGWEAKFRMRDVVRMMVEAEKTLLDEK